MAPKIFRALHQAIKQGLILSCHDLSEGGLAVAAAEMAFAGGVGVELQVECGSAVELFSESNTRFLVEVAESSAAGLESVLGILPHQRVGQTAEGSVFRVQGANQVLIHETLSVLKSSWQRPLQL